MKSLVLLWLSACALLAAQQAPIPTADELSGQPYSIKKTWVIGGVGDWDYMTLDPTARQLFIAHGPTVQVVDIDAGIVAGTVSGFRQAHAIALDQAGQFGYVTDGPAGQVKVFDRRTFEVLANIQLGASPRALALDPQTGLLFAVETGSTNLAQGEPPAQRPPADGRHVSGSKPAGNPPNNAQSVGPCGMTPGSRTAPLSESMVSVIDTEKRSEVAEIRLCGILGFAQSDGRGGVFVNMTSLNQAARLDASAILQQVRSAHDDASAHSRTSARDHWIELDWRNSSQNGSRGRANALPPLQLVGLGPDCKAPRGVAVDGTQHRLFATCSNMKMAVVNTDTGEVVASLTIGPGADAIVYDSNHGLIFTANGGGYGSVTVVRQHVTDTYSVIQNLPTMQQARTMAVDPSTGLAYLVTSLYGAKLDHPPANGIGSLKASSVDGSFQVLVIGN